MQNEQQNPYVYRQESVPQQVEQQPVPDPKHRAKRYAVAGLAAVVLAVILSFGAYVFAQRQKSPALSQQAAPATENDSQFDTDDIDLPPAADSKTVDAPAVEEHRASSDSEQHADNHQ